MTFIDKIETAVLSIQNKIKRPTFVYEDTVEVDDVYQAMNIISEQKITTFPFVYISSKYQQREVIKGKEYETDITLWIVGKSEEDYDSEDRREKVLPALWAIESDLKRAIELNLGEYEGYTTEPDYYKKSEVHFDTPVNVIRMRFDGLKYQLIEC